MKTEAPQNISNTYTKYLGSLIEIMYYLVAVSKETIIVTILHNTIKIISIYFVIDSIKLGFNLFSLLCDAVPSKQLFQVRESNSINTAPFALRHPGTSSVSI